MNVCANFLSYKMNLLCHTMVYVVLRPGTTIDKYRNIDRFLKYLFSTFTRSINILCKTIHFFDVKAVDCQHITPVILVVHNFVGATHSLNKTLEINGRPLIAEALHQSSYSC